MERANCLDRIIPGILYFQPHLIHSSETMSAKRNDRTIILRLRANSQLCSIDDSGSQRGTGAGHHLWRRCNCHHSRRWRNLMHFNNGVYPRIGMENAADRPDVERHPVQSDESIDQRSYQQNEKDEQGESRRNTDVAQTCFTGRSPCGLWPSHRHRLLLKRPVAFARPRAGQRFAALHVQQHLI